MRSFSSTIQPEIARNGSLLFSTTRSNNMAHYPKLLDDAVSIVGVISIRLDHSAWEVHLLVVSKDSACQGCYVLSKDFLVAIYCRSPNPASKLAVMRNVSPETRSDGWFFFSGLMWWPWSCCSSSRASRWACWKWTISESPIIFSSVSEVF